MKMKSETRISKSETNTKFQISNTPFITLFEIRISKFGFTLCVLRASVVIYSAVCSPHSVFWKPLQRPARSSSPNITARVQGQQPMLG
jgi:hypothetical protein